MQNVRLRSSNLGNANVWNVNNSGNVNNNNPMNGYRVAPDWYAPRKNNTFHRKATDGVK